MRDYITNVGPSDRTIPARSYKSCSDCKFYNHSLVRSGMDPVYKRNCDHPELPMDRKLMGGIFRGNLDSSETPNWCPVLNDKNKL